MPTLVRFLVVLIVLAAIGIAGMFYLANFVEPHTREMTVKVPADRLQAKEVAPAPAVAASRQPAEAQGNMPKIPEPKERRVRVLHKGGGSYARSATKRREEHTARLGFSAEPSPFFQSW